MVMIRIIKMNKSMMITDNKGNNDNRDNYNFPEEILLKNKQSNMFKKLHLLYRLLDIIEKYKENQI